jgi:hypothetical protein
MRASCLNVLKEVFHTDIRLGSLPFLAAGFTPQEMRSGADQFARMLKLPPPPESLLFSLRSFEELIDYAIRQKIEAARNVSSKKTWYAVRARRVAFLLAVCLPLLIVLLIVLGKIQ